MTMTEIRPAQTRPDGAARPRRPTIESMRARVGDLLVQMPTHNLQDAVVRDGWANLSDLLEAEDPSDQGDAALGLDAFQRMMLVKGINTASRPGRMADEVEAFGRDAEARALFPEWARRQWEAGRGAAPVTTRAPALYLSGDYVAGTIQRPYDDDRTLRFTETQPAVPLVEMIARTRGNAGRDYRARRLVQPAAADVRMLRVAEAAELPEAVIRETQSVIQLSKYGRKLTASYEALRRLPLDDFAVYIRLLGIQTEVDQVDAALDVMINGDGNPGTAATTYNLTTLDPGTTVNNLSVAGWLAFLTTWQNPYAMSAVIGQQAAIIKLLMLAMPSVNLLATTLPVSSGITQAFTPMNTRLTQGQRYGITASAPVSKLVGFDGRFALEQVRENGSQISESERWITRQTETLTFSFNEAFAVFITGQAHILNIAA